MVVVVWVVKVCFFSVSVCVCVFVKDTCELTYFEGAVAVTPAAYLSIVKNIIFLCVCVCLKMPMIFIIFHV